MKRVIEVNGLTHIGNGQRPGTGAAAVRLVKGTVMFTDIVAFGRYAALHGDRAILELFSTQRRLARELLPSGARVVKELGDGLMLWFPDAQDALETGLRLQEAFDQGAGCGSTPVELRVGCHSGQQILWDEDFVGNDVNVAARIVRRARPGEVLFSHSTLAGLRGENGHFRIKPLGSILLKGMPDAVRLYLAQRPSTAQAG